MNKGVVSFFMKLKQIQTDSGFLQYPLTEFSVYKERGGGGGGGGGEMLHGIRRGE